MFGVMFLDMSDVPGCARCAYSGHTAGRVRRRSITVMQCDESRLEKSQNLKCCIM